MNACIKSKKKKIRGKKLIKPGDMGERKGGAEGAAEGGAEGGRGLARWHSGYMIPTGCEMHFGIRNSQFWDYFWLENFGFDSLILGHSKHCKIHGELFWCSFLFSKICLTFVRND